MTTLISFYTNDWKYPQHAKRLAVECENIGLYYVIEELPSTNSYLKNTCLKPQFILDKLLELKSSVLWVDVDGSVLKKPHMTYFADFAACPMNPDRKRTWHVGTMWFNYTPAMITFIKEWIRNTGNLSDESALEKTWQKHGYRLSTVELSKEYFQIEQRGKQPPSDTIIMHRISNGDVKRSEMPIARRKREEGVW